MYSIILPNLFDPLSNLIYIYIYIYINCSTKQCLSKLRLQNPLDILWQHPYHHESLLGDELLYSCCLQTCLLNEQNQNSQIWFRSQWSHFSKNIIIFLNIQNTDSFTQNTYCQPFLHLFLNNNQSVHTCRENGVYKLKRKLNKHQDTTKMT